MTNARYCGWLAYTVVVIGALAASAGSVEAQERKKPRAPKVIELEEIKIEGRVQKPNAFYILNRSNIGYEVMELRTSFINEVIRSVRRDPF
jgi:hypothetical protein